MPVHDSWAVTTQYNGAEYLFKWHIGSMGIFKLQNQMKKESRWRFHVGHWEIWQVCMGRYTMESLCKRFTIAITIAIAIAITITITITVTVTITITITITLTITITITICGEATLLTV